MAQILVRDLDLETVQLLKKRASENRRSLQAEVKVILENVTRGAVQQATREEILRLSRTLRDLNGPQSSDSVDLLREDRDR